MTEGYSPIFQPDLDVQSYMNKMMTNTRSLFSNRISFLFDFKGPSIMTDTACSASLTAFNLAMNDLRLGNFIINFLIVQIDISVNEQDISNMRLLADPIRH